MITVEFKDFDEMMAFARQLTGAAFAKEPAQQTVPAQVYTPGVAAPADSPAAPNRQPAPAVPTAPAAQVPTTAASYTLDDLARAGMTLMDAGRQADLLGLLQEFGVEALPALPPTQFGAFATRLREMGAQI